MDLTSLPRSSIPASNVFDDFVMKKRGLVDGDRFIPGSAQCMSGLDADEADMSLVHFFHDETMTAVTSGRPFRAGSGRIHRGKTRPGSCSPALSGSWKASVLLMFLMPAAPLMRKAFSPGWREPVLFVGVVFVLDVADDFFEDVFQGDDAFHVAEFVDDEGQMDGIFLHLDQDLFDRRRFGDEERLAEKSWSGRCLDVRRERG